MPSPLPTILHIPLCVAAAFLGGALLGERSGDPSRLSGRQRARRLPDDESDRAAPHRLCGRASTQGAGPDQQAARHSRHGDPAELLVVLAAQCRNLHRARVLRDRRRLSTAATVRGFEWKIIGLNPRFAHYGGIDVRSNALAVFPGERRRRRPRRRRAGARRLQGLLRQFLAGLRLRRHRGRDARQEQPHRRDLRGIPVRRDECRKRVSCR